MEEKSVDVEINVTGLEVEAITAQQAADMDAEYQTLLRAYLNTSNMMSPTVAIAALMTAAGCIAVQVFEDEQQCRRYLSKCGMDVIQKVPEAYAAKQTQKEQSDGSDAGEKS